MFTIVFVNYYTCQKVVLDMHVRFSFKSSPISDIVTLFRDYLICEPDNRLVFKNDFCLNVHMP